MDQALEKSYNIPVSGHSGFMEITSTKDTVGKWSIIKHEEQQFADLSYNLYSLNRDEEYSLHEYSTAVTKADEMCVTKIR